MNTIQHLASYMDAATLLQAFGPWVIAGIALVVFIESGVLFPFLPGDSLLVTAAILRENLNVSIWLLVLVGIAAAVAGDQVGYWIGHRWGRGLFKEEAKLLKLEYLKSAEDFFRKHGPLALILGRFAPFVRTFVPVAAGAAGMQYKNFVGWNVSGAVAWVASMNVVGVFLGTIPGIADSIEKIMLLIVALSVAPIVVKSLYNYIEGKKKATAAETSLASQE